VTNQAELRVLGGLALHVDGQSLKLGGPKTQRLLSVLVAHRQAHLVTDRLVGAVWGDEPPRSAKPTIQTQISRLRSILAPNFAITHESAGYRFEVLDGVIDADRFESLLAKVRTLGTDESLPMLDAALGLWHGEAFGQFAEMPEVHHEAARLDELRLVATDQWAEAKMASGDPAQVVGDLDALVSLHPLRESYWRLLMLALYRSGRQAEALRRANEFRSILRQDAGLDLSPALRDLETQILADDPRLHLGADQAQQSRPVPVAAPQLFGATSFIGRDPDLASLVDALETHPLITITGPGGVGKTRLAMRVAGHVIDQFEDGVTVVEFAALRDPAGVAQLISRALDVQTQPHRTIEATIEEFLAPSKLLLLLDNCEHVTANLAPIVDRLRSACPWLKILATSRQPLGLAGEYIDALVPLTVPNSGSELVGEIGRSPAVQLFVARAEASFPGFTLTDDNAVAVADICRRLDGLPLALELAAARLRNMGVDGLLARLHQRIQMPGQTMRGADGRQRTLEDLVRWSHNLLGLEERQVFEQLAVFVGGFDLAASELVCVTDESRIAAENHLTSLVDKSMVLLVDPIGSRYRMLAPLRVFGLDRLREHLAERGAAGLDSPDEATWSALLHRDYDNFRVALRTAADRSDAASALRLVASMREFAFRRVNYEITSWADEAVGLPGARSNPDLPTVLAVSAYGSFVRGDMETAVEVALRALATPGSSDLSQSGLPERVLGNAYFYMEQIDEALAWMERLLLSARRADSGGRIVQALYMTSVAQTSLGDGIRGAVLAGQAKAAAEALGSPTAHAQADYALGLALKSTDAAEALSLLERAASLGAKVGNRWIEAFALTEVHSLRAASGDHLLAMAGYAEVVDTWYRGGDYAYQRLSLRRVLGILVKLGALEAAAVLHGWLAAVGAAQALPIVPGDAKRLSQDVDEVRSSLGRAAFDLAELRGASMGDREIVNFVKQQITSLAEESSGAVSIDVHGGLIGVSLPPIG